VGGAIPFQFIPAVEKGVRRALFEGAIAGFPIQDVRVTVHDGKSHAVDSKEVAFVAAGRKAFLDAVAKASPVVLEPIVRLEITIPSAAIGEVTGDLASRRGRVTGNLPLSAQRAVLTAAAPLAEVRDYASGLKSMTSGEGTYTLDLSHYEAAPPRRQDELRAAFKPVADDD
jgi:elongation factor G